MTRRPTTKLVTGVAMERPRIGKQPCVTGSMHLRRLWGQSFPSARRFGRVAWSRERSEPQTRPTLAQGPVALHAVRRGGVDALGRRPCPMRDARPHSEGVCASGRGMRSIHLGVIISGFGIANGGGGSSGGRKLHAGLSCTPSRAPHPSRPRPPFVHLTSGEGRALAPPRRAMNISPIWARLCACSGHIGELGWVCFRMTFGGLVSESERVVQCGWRSFEGVVTLLDAIASECKVC